MVICGRCQLNFHPNLETGDEQTLCEDCITDLISTRQKKCPVDERESIRILESVITCLSPNSEVQALLESPGVPLTLAKLTATCSRDIHMLALNSFRVGAYLAFQQAKVNRIIQ